MHSTRHQLIQMQVSRYYQGSRPSAMVRLAVSHVSRSCQVVLTRHGQHSVLCFAVVIEALHARPSESGTSHLKVAIGSTSWLDHQLFPDRLLFAATLERWHGSKGGIDALLQTATRLSSYRSMGKHLLPWGVCAQHT